MDHRQRRLALRLLAASASLGCGAAPAEPAGVQFVASRAAMAPGDYAPVDPLSTVSSQSAAPALGPPSVPAPGAATPNAATPSAAMPGAPVAAGAPARGGSGAPLPAGPSGTPTEAPAGPAGPSAGSLTVSLSTTDQGARYSPRNVGAIWVETASGTFVKTLERWASSRARYLERWTAASGGWSARGGQSGDQLDAVSRATLRTEQKHQATWNMHDAMGQLVPDGSYRLAIEVSEVDGAGKFETIPFDKGPMPAQLAPPDKSPYAGVSIVYQP